jgi:four helix bundle protein
LIRCRGGAVRAVDGDVASGEGEMAVFDFEQLDVFKAAAEMVICVDEIAESLPRGRGYMSDQLRRAANSVVLNISEGAGEYSAGEKARFYRMAKRSATEAAAQVIVASRLQLTGEAEVARARELLHRVVSMLVRMASRAEERAA